MFRNSFPFDLAAGATLYQNFNIDYPTFGTTKGFLVRISSKNGGPVLLQLGSIDGATLDQSTFSLFAYKHFPDTLVTKEWSEPRFTWNYLTNDVELQVTNLSDAADTFYCTCVSDSADSP